MANLINSNAPNVVEFQKRGGKLIIIHNTADMAVSPVATMNSQKRCRRRQPMRRDFRS